ncbi:MAG: preprotein translocase subunit SecE [Candidatus Omnitrophota bacterium]
MGNGSLNFFQAVPKFFKEVAAELKKVSWTSRQDLISSAWLVIVSSLFLGLFIAVTDLILSGIIQKIIK